LFLSLLKNPDFLTHLLIIFLQAMSANVQPLLQQVGSPSGQSDSSTRISTPAELKLERSGVRSPLSLAHHHQQPQQQHQQQQPQQQQQHQVPILSTLSFFFLPTFVACR
jgi:hypothetical protein